MVGKIDDLLAKTNSPTLAYFWHGMGRGLYFLPTEFVPADGLTWQALQKAQREPPPVRFDPSISPRFVMLDAICKFDNGKDGFRGFGTGQTFPVSYGGKPEIPAGAVGNITEGFGKFRGLEGTYTYCGTLSADSGFRGSVLCRVVDPEGILQSSMDLPDLQQISFPELDASYLTFRGQKKNRTQKTQYMFGSDGQVSGLQLEPQIRLFNFDCAIDGRGELRSTSSVGQVVGTMPSYIFFNVLNPGAPGTADALSPSMITINISLAVRTAELLAALGSMVAADALWD